MYFLGDAFSENNIKVTNVFKDALWCWYEPYCHLLLLFSSSVLPTLCNPIDCQASLSFTISWSLLKLMSVESVMPFNDLVLCCHLLLLPSIFPSIRDFSNESIVCFRWPKYWSFSFSPSSEYSGLISFRIDCD